MPKIFLKFDSLFGYLLMLYGLLLPFGVAIPNIMIGVLVLYWFIAIFKRKVTFDRNSLILISSFVLVYFFTILSILYSDNKQHAWEVVIRKFPLFLFPLIIFSVDFNDKKKIVFNTVFLFATATTVVLFINLFSAIYTWSSSSYNNTLIDAITLDKLSYAATGFHYLYLGLFTSFAIIFYWYSLLFIEMLRKIFRIIIIINLPILFLFLFLLGGRNSIITTIIITSSILLLKTIKSRRYYMLFVYSTFIILIAIINMKLNPFMYERFKEMVNYENKYTLKDHWGGRGVRLAMWESAYEIIQDNLIFGVGVGDSQDLLNNKHKERKINSLTYFNKSYNAHNIFIQHLLSIGLIGLILLLISMLYPFYKSVLNMNYLFIIFLVMFVMTSLSESFLERNSGIIFYGFFSSLLYLHNENKYI